MKHQSQKRNSFHMHWNCNFLQTILERFEVFWETTNNYPENKSKTCLPFIGPSQWLTLNSKELERYLRREIWSQNSGALGESPGPHMKIARSHLQNINKIPGVNCKKWAETLLKFWFNGTEANPKSRHWSLASSFPTRTRVTREIPPDTRLQ